MIIHGEQLKKLSNKDLDNIVKHYSCVCCHYIFNDKFLEENNFFYLSFCIIRR